MDSDKYYLDEKTGTFRLKRTEPEYVYISRYINIPGTTESTMRSPPDVLFCEK